MGDRNQPISHYQRLTDTCTWTRVINQNFRAKLLKLLQSIALEQNVKTREKLEEKLSKSFYSKPSCLPALIEIGASDNQEILHTTKYLALIRAKDQLYKWNETPITTLQQIKQALLSSMFTETSHVVRKQLVELFAEIWSKELDNSGFEELILRIVQGSQGDVFQREVCSSLCFSLLDYMGVEIFLSYDAFSLLFSNFWLMPIVMKFG